MQVLHPVCCGIDVHSAQLTACLRRVSDDGQITTELVDCGTTYRALIAFRTWLQEQQCPVVAMESTGVYWKPVYHVLSEAVAVCVANSQDVRQRPGKKTDESDATWIAELLAHGLITQNRHPKPSSACKSTHKGVNAMRHSTGHCFLSPSSRDGAAYADGLYLSPWVCDPGLSRHANRMARPASPHLLLAGVHAGRAPRATYLGRDGAVDSSIHHCLAFWPLAQSRLLERASPCELVGTGSRGHLASPGERHPLSLWRWQPRRQTWHQESGGAERAEQETAALVFWPAFCLADGGLGQLSLPCGLSAHS